jgi:hypothetical protein
LPPAKTTKTAETAERLAKIETQVDYLAQTDQQKIKMLDEILAQAKITNGRVTQHDIWIAQHTSETSTAHEKLEEAQHLAKEHEKFFNHLKGAWWAFGLLSAAVGAVIALIVQGFSK